MYVIRSTVSPYRVLSASEVDTSTRAATQAAADWCDEYYLNSEIATVSTELPPNIIMAGYSSTTPIPLTPLTDSVSTNAIATAALSSTTLPSITSLTPVPSSVSNLTGIDLVLPKIYTARSYEIRYSTASGSAGPFTYTSVNDDGTLSGTVTVRIENLLPSTIYYFNMRAIFQWGASNWSDPQSSCISGAGTGDSKTILNYSGTDDNTRMMNMLADCGNIILPAGYTALVDPLSISAKYCASITGLGGLAMIRLKPGSNADLLTIDGTGSGSANPIGGYFHAENIIFDGNRYNQTAGDAVIRLRNASYSVISRCVIYQGYGDGIIIENHDTSVDADEINIENNMIFFNRLNGMSMIYSGSGGGQAPGDHLIIGNHINYNGLHGIYCPAGYATLITGNNILTNGGCGLKLETCSRFTIQGNQVRYNAGPGMNAGVDGSGISNSQVIGNQFHLNTRDGHGENINIWHSSDVVISGNHCNDADFTAINYYGAQFHGCYNLAITGNVFRGTMGGVALSETSYTAKGNVGLADFNLPETTTDHEGKVIRYAERKYTPSSTGVDTCSAIYIDVKPRNDADNGPAQVQGIQIDVHDQIDTYGCGIIVKHYGEGDAIYVPMFSNSGAAFKAASLTNGTKGIISTLQHSNCFYVTLFNALWDQLNEPGYGMYWAGMSPAKAFVAQRKNGASASSCQFEIVDESITRIWGVRNDGKMICADGTILSAAYGPVGAVYSCVNATPPADGGTWASIGTQTIGAETVTYYKRTA